MIARTTSIALVAICFLASGPANAAPSAKAEMAKLASALTKLTTAVEGLVHYNTSPEVPSEKELLRRVIESDARLLEPFKRYSLRLKAQDRHAVVLLCAGGLGRALLEDAGCTGPLDKNSWQDSTPSGCEFTLDPAIVCPQPQLPEPRTGSATLETGKPD